MKFPRQNLENSKKRSIFASANAEIAQSVEHQLPKLRVAGSNPVFRSKTGGLRNQAYFVLRISKSHKASGSAQRAHSSTKAQRKTITGVFCNCAKSRSYSPGYIDVRMKEKLASIIASPQHLAPDVTSIMLLTPWSTLRAHQRLHSTGRPQGAEAVARKHIQQKE